MPDFTQENRFLTIKTPLDEDALLLRSFEGEEELSQPFRFSLDMLAQDPALDMSKLIGQPVTFAAKLPDDELRYFNGKVLRIAAGEVETHEKAHRQFHAEVVPNLWFLKFNANSRVFQNKTIPDIVKQVWEDAGLTDLKVSTRGKYAKLEYCVQYNESDYQFVSRLLEKVGISYYVQHDKGKHVTVLFDEASGYTKCVESKVDFAGIFSFPRYGEIAKWERRIEFTSGKYAVTDYNFETSATNLLTKEKSILKTKGISDYEVYEYPGGYMKTADGKPIATARMEALEVPGEVVIGAGSCLSFTPGGKFQLKSHHVKSEAKVGYALVAVNHQAYEPTLTLGRDASDRDEAPYSNQFRCIPEKTVFRPARVTPVPRIHGLQTAKVVGAKANDVFTDEFGRVKLQFHWDREGKFDDKSSCWVRVAQSWAGAKRGTLFTPRVGDEVVVDFLDGDPDRPLVVGSLYNDANATPYKLPDKAAHSGIKTLSIDKGKADEFNELRFDDTAGKEQIYFHAQKDFVRIVENDDKLKVGYDKKDKGDQTIEIYNDRSVTIHKGMDLLTVNTKDRKVCIDKGDYLVDIKMGNHKLTVKAGKSETEAAQKIVLKVGGSSIVMTPTDIKIKAVNVSISGDLSAKLKGGVSAEVAGGASTTIKGGIVSIN